MYSPYKVYATFNVLSSIYIISFTFFMEQNIFSIEKRLPTERCEQQTNKTTCEKDLKCSLSIFSTENTFLFIAIIDEIV
jgi:hypothetical protein